jgi:hypothetical protein
LTQSPLGESTKIVESRIIGQNFHLEYPGANSNIVESIVSYVIVELVDETKTCLLASIDMFYLFVKIVSKKKECENGINKPM